MKELLTTVTVGVLSLSLLSMLVPKEEKTLKYLISIVFLCVLIFPIVNIIPTIKAEKIGIENVEIKDEVLEIQTATTQNLIADILKRNNIEFKKITVFANISEDYSITINSVEIVSNEDEEVIRKALKELDFKKVVRYEG